MADNLNPSNKKISAKSFLGGDKVEKYRQELIAEGKIPGTKLNATPEERRQAFNLYRKNKIDFKNFVEKVLQKKDSVSYAGISKLDDGVKRLTGVGAIVKAPPKGLSIISKKPEEREKEKSPFEGTFKVLNSILTTLKNQFKFDKKKREDERKEKEGQKRSKREEGLEGFKKGVSMVASATKKMLAPFQDIIDRIWRFIFFTLLGRAFTQLMDWLGDPKNKKKIDSLGRFLKDFFPAIAAAAALFLTPLGGFIRGTIKMLRFFIPQIVRFLAANPMLTGLTLATIGGIAKIKESEAMKPQTEKSQAEIDKTLSDKKEPWYKKLGASFAGQSLNAPGGPKNPIGLPTPGAMYANGGMIPRFAAGGINFGTGYDGIDGNTGQKVSGFGPDTQAIIAQPGEIVMNKKTVDAVGADHFLALNRQYGGPGANKPKMGKMYNTGGMVGMQRGGLYSPVMRIMHGTKEGVPELIRSGGFKEQTGMLGKGVYGSVKGWVADTYRGAGALKGILPGQGPRLNMIVPQASRTLRGATAVSSDIANRGLSLADRLLAGQYPKSAKAAQLRGMLSTPTPTMSRAFSGGISKLGTRLLRVPLINDMLFPEAVGQYDQLTGPNAYYNTPGYKGPKPSKKQDGGHVKENTGMNIRGATADRQLTALQPGEYVLPVDTVSRLGTSLIDKLVAMTDGNSTPAKLGKRNISRPQITPLRRGQSGIMSLPPITQSASAAGVGAAAAGSKIPTFSAVSPSGSSERSTNASIYGIVG